MASQPPSLPPSLQQRMAAWGRRPRSRRSTAVVTLLTPPERARVDAASDGHFVPIHRDRLEEAVEDLRSYRAQALIVSVARYNTEAAPMVARVVREFPAYPTVAILSDNAPDRLFGVLALGHSGVSTLVDVRDPEGWQRLRHHLTEHQGASIERLSIHKIDKQLADAPEDCRRFLHSCFLAPPAISKLQQLSHRLGVHTTTLTSRFYRAKLPAPKRYLTLARLVRAAALFENPGLSISQVAHAMEYSSPQSFSRHVIAQLAVTASTFRERFTGERMLDRYIDTLVVPYLDTLRHFHPLIVLPAWAGPLRSPEPSPSSGP